MKKILQNNLILFWLFLFILNKPLFSNQSNSIYIQTYFANNTNKPFWMKSNRWGVNPGNSIGLNFNYNSSKFNFLRFKGNIVKTDNNFQIIEGNFSLAIKNYQIKIGKIKYLHGLPNHDLSSGSLILSKNAEPIPKILIENIDSFIFEINRIKI